MFCIYIDRFFPILFTPGKYEFAKYSKIKTVLYHKVKHIIQTTKQDQTAVCCVISANLPRGLVTYNLPDVSNDLRNEAR